MKIIIKKAERLLQLLDGTSEVLRCDISLGNEPIGPKRTEGDGRTPEGIYRICSRNERSKFYLALGLSYPNAADAKRALSEGRIGRIVYWRLLVADLLGIRPAWNTALGGFVMIHGEHPEGKTGDWTAGCIAVKNEDMRILYDKCSKGTEVEIR